jgi:phage terminase small subunit
MTSKSPPETLTAETRKIWGELNKRFVFEYEDMLVLKTALENYDLMMKALKELGKGFTIKGKGGTAKGNPALRGYHIARTGFLEAWKALNLNVEPPRGVGRPPGQWPSV